MKKQVFFAGLAIALTVLFVFMPVSASDLIIRMYFDDIEGEDCVLYYATDIENVFTQEKSVVSEIDCEQKLVEFRLDKSCDGHLTMLRLDLPQQAEQLVCIKNITVSSGGVIQKEYSPCEFFEDRNVDLLREIEVTRVYPKKRTYLEIGPEDPYVVLSGEMTQELQSYFSHRGLSRLGLCMFIAGCYFISRKKIFA